MLTPDLELAQRFLHAHPPPGEALLVGVTGAHAYGFPSPDSDLDLKGIHLAPARQLLGLHPDTPAHDLTVVFDGVECDLTTNEAAGALRLLLRGNGNMAERILSPIQVIGGPDLADLQRLARGAISRRFAKHYAGFFQGCCREHERNATAKSMLYSYRVAATGTWLLRTGEVVCDLTDLAPELGLEGIDELIAVKQAAEHSALPADLDRLHRARWSELRAMMEHAEASTSLPVAPANDTEVDDWLVQRRGFG